MLAACAAGCLLAVLTPGDAAASTGFRYKGVIDQDEVMDSGSGMPLASGKVYTLARDNVTLDFSNEDVSASPLRVAANSTAVIFLKRGQTLTVKGSVAEDANGGYPGIQIGKDGTLVVTGEGRLVATGGNATSGTNGKPGTNAKVEYETSKAGEGGEGGDGGSGAGAGIGGYGGRGGYGGASGGTPRADQIVGP